MDTGVSPEPQLRSLIACAQIGQLRKWQGNPWKLLLKCECWWVVGAEDAVYGRCVFTNNNLVVESVDLSESDDK